MEKDKMPKHLLFGAGGMVFGEDPSELLNTSVAEPAPGPTPSSCPGEDPEIVLTVFDADYAGGDINWCGATWTQAEVQSGASKTVCPTSYNLANRETLTYGGNNAERFQNRWTNNQDGGLKLFRNYFAIEFGGKWFRYGGPTSSLRCLSYITVRGQNDRRVIAGGGSPTVNSRPVTGGLATWSTMQIGILGTASFTTGKPEPASPPYHADSTDYALVDAYFSSHTISGVTYTWAKGNGW